MNPLIDPESWLNHPARQAWRQQIQAAGTAGLPTTEPVPLALVEKENGWALIDHTGRKHFISREPPFDAEEITNHGRRQPFSKAEITEDGRRPKKRKETA